MCSTHRAGLQHSTPAPSGHPEGVTSSASVGVRKSWSDTLVNTAVPLTCTRSSCSYINLQHNFCSIRSRLYSDPRQSTTITALDSKLHSTTVDMWQRYVSLIVAITCMCFLVQAQSELYPLGEKRNTAKYCGSILADVLATVCKGVYNMQINKKSTYDGDSDEDYAYMQQPAYLEDIRLPFPYRSRPNAAALISGSFRRYSRGITDECCRKSCSMAELKTYCGKP